MFIRFLTNIIMNVELCIELNNSFFLTFTNEWMAMVDKFLFYCHVHFCRPIFFSFILFFLSSFALPLLSLCCCLFVNVCLCYYASVQMTTTRTQVTTTTTTKKQKKTEEKIECILNYTNLMSRMRIFVHCQQPLVVCTHSDEWKKLK